MAVVTMNLITTIATYGFKMNDYYEVKLYLITVVKRFGHFWWMLFKMM